MNYCKSHNQKPNDTLASRRDITYLLFYLPRIWMVFLVVFSIGLVSVSTAQTTVWNGSVDENWLNPANWSNGVPDEDTNAEIQWFPASNSDPVITNSTSFRELRINNFGRAVQVTVADDVDVSLDNLIVAATGTPGQIAFNVANGHVTVNNSVEISGAIFVDDGSITFLDDFSLVNSGLFTVQTGTVNVGDPGPPVISADFNINNNSVFNLNYGTLNIYGSSGFNNSGTFNAGSGNIVLDGDITLSGNTNFNAETSTVTITSNSTITVDNNIDGNTISFYDLNIEGDAEVVSNSNVVVNNNMSVDETANYQQSDGTTLNVVGTVTGDPEISTDRPYIISIIIHSPSRISAVFDEPLQETSATNPANYRVEDASGNTIDNPTNFSLGGPMNNVVTMDLGFGIQQDVRYYLIVNNVSDLDGLTVSTNHRKRFQDASPPTFFSRQSGSWNQASSWSIVSHSGPTAPRVPGQAGDQVQIGDNHTVTVSSTVSIELLASISVNETGILRIEAGAIFETADTVVEGAGFFELMPNATLRIGSEEGIQASGNLGNIHTSSRSFSPQANYEYNGTVAQVTGSGLPESVSSLIIDNPEQVLLSSDVIVTGNLSLTNGVFQISSGSSLIADTRTIGNGSIQYLRTISGSKGWRVMSSPVATGFSDFLSGNDGGFVSQGFPGADFPDEQPNILYFSENTAGDTVMTNMNWVSISSLSDPVIAGTGYFIYAFDGASGPGSVPSRPDELPFTIAVTGNEIPVSGLFDFDVSYTARQIYTDDEGWNLVGNPYGAALDWDDASNWVREQMHNSIYVWDPSAGGGSGAYREWNGVTGSLGDGRIASFQAFWVKAENPGAELQVSADARTTGGSGFHGKMIAGADNHTTEMVLKANHDASGLHGETRVLFSRTGRIGSDPYDAYRLVPLTDTYLSVFSVRDDRMPLSINSLPEQLETETIIPLELYGAVHGMALQGRVSITWDDIESIPGHYAVFLEDTREKRTIDMRSQTSYHFELSSTNSSYFKQAASVSIQKVSADQRIEEPIITVNQPGNDFSLKQKAVTVQTRFQIRIVQREVSPRMGEMVSERVELLQNYPNPFNPSTTFRFSLPDDRHVSLSVYDILGRRVARLTDQVYSKGTHDLFWDAQHLGSGTYIYRLQSGDVIQHRKMMLVK